MDCADAHAHFDIRSLATMGFSDNAAHMYVSRAIKADTILFVCVLKRMTHIQYWESKTLDYLVHPCSLIKALIAKALLRLPGCAG